MAFYIVTKDLDVTHHRYEVRARAEEKRLEVAQRVGLSPDDVIVVIADSDTHARGVADAIFSRR